MINFTRKTTRDLGSTGGRLGEKEGRGGRHVMQDMATGEPPAGQGCRAADKHVMDHVQSGYGGLDLVLLKLYFLVTFGKY